jgi:hypothetical protein
MAGRGGSVRRQILLIVFTISLKIFFCPKVVVMLLLATNYIPVVINHILMAFYTSTVPSHCKVHTQPVFVNDYGAQESITPSLCSLAGRYVK